jgi:hypothetical protein
MRPLLYTTTKVNLADFIICIFIFIFNLITCIRTTSLSTDVQHTSYNICIILRTCNGSVVLKIVLQISNCISHMKMARRGRNM